MKKRNVSTEFYDPQFFTGGPNERSRTMFGDADIQGNLTSGFSYQDLLKFLDANPNTLGENNRPGAGGGVYEKVRIGVKQEQDAEARQQAEAKRQQELDRIASRAEAQQQKEAAILDGANAWSQFRNLTLPHLARPIAIVIMIQAIFHLSLYAEIEIVSRGNGNKNLPYLIGEFSSNNIGAASATGIFAVILANIVAIFLLRIVGKNLVD